MNNEEVLTSRAKIFENTTQQKVIMVENFGSEGQKNHFEKNNGFKDSKREEPFLRTLRQYFESVELVKVKGVRAKQYKLGAAREEIATRQDDRETNGGRELSYTKYLDAIVLLALDSKMFSEHETTMAKWVLNFGLANELIFNIKTNPNSIDSHNIKRGLPSSRVPELSVYAEDFRDKERILKRTLEKMDKTNLVDFYPVAKASVITGVKYITEDNEPVYSTAIIDLKSETVGLLNEKRRSLLEELRITEFHIRIGKSSNKDTQKKIDKFNQEIQDFYKNEVYQRDDDGKNRHLWIQFHWFNYALSVKATKTRIKNYLKKHREEFYAEYIKDSDLFLSSSQENYRIERFKDIIKKAEKEKSRVLLYLEEERKKEEVKGLNAINRDVRGKISYWENEYIDNVEKLGEYFEPDCDIRPRHETY